MDNIANQQPELIRKFSRQLQAWLTQTNDPFANYITP